MYVVVVSATAGEISAAADQLRNRASANAAHEIETVTCGVGLVPTTYHLTRILTRKPDLIIQAGIAGSFAPGNIGKVFSISSETFGDVGVLEQNTFKSIFDLNLSDPNQYPFTQARLVNPHTNLLDWVALQTAAATSVNEITTNPERISWFQQNTDCIVESMEGAAFHYVCLMEKVPFLQIRSISNDVGERDKVRWRMQEAIQALNQTLISLIDKLTDPDETNLRF